MAVRSEEGRGSFCKVLQAGVVASVSMRTECFIVTSRGDDFAMWNLWL